MTRGPVDGPAAEVRGELGGSLGHAVAEDHLDAALDQSEGVPRPAGIELSVDVGSMTANDLPYKSATFSVLWRLPGTEETYYMVARDTTDDVRHSLQFTDLAPATYMVDVHTTPKPGVQPIAKLQINPGAFFDSRVLKLQPGKTTAVRFEYTPFNPAAFRGERTVFVRIRRPDRLPARGEKLKIAYFDGHYGLVPVFDGIVPDSGEVKLTSVTERVTGFLSRGSYWVSIDGRHIGDFDLSGDEKTQRFDFLIPLGESDAAPDVEFVEMATGTIARLGHLRGKIVFLEFWATWCGPCQSAMDKFNTLAAERRDQWGNRVALVALSVDDSIELADLHVKQRGWTALQHFWSGGKMKGTQSPAARSFVMDRVPIAFLIDSNGKIVWRGNPVTDDQSVRARIEKLLSDK